MKAWTPDFLAFVLPLRAEDVLRCEGPRDNAPTPQSREEWAWIQTAQRLVECHGWGGGSGPAERLRPRTGHAGRA
ncbi:MAG: hypothetical protein JF588_19310 [Caulobacterales bacterium]|nr:hypothetical protein [Caulobacterales bacterium]